MITMMQPAKTRQGDDAATRASALLRRPVPRRFFSQAKMRPVLVIIADVVIHEACQMVCVEHDHMIKQFATTAANEPFRNAILPRTSEAGPFGWIPKLFMVSMTSPSKFDARSKIKYLGAQS